MNNFLSRSLLFLTLLFLLQHADAQNFSLVKKGRVCMILYSKQGPKLDSISANMLAEDIERVTSYKPTVITDLAKAKGNIIVIGNIQSGLLENL